MITLSDGAGTQDINLTAAPGVADLMRRAVAEAEREQRRRQLFRSLTERRRRRPAASDEAKREARERGRP